MPVRVGTGTWCSLLYARRQRLGPAPAGLFRCPPKPLRSPLSAISVCRVTSPWAIAKLIADHPYPFEILFIVVNHPDEKLQPIQTLGSLTGEKAAVRHLSRFQVKASRPAHSQYSGTAYI